MTGKELKSQRLGSSLIRREGCRVNNILGLSTVHRLLGWCATVHESRYIMGNGVRVTVGGMAISE